MGSQETSISGSQISEPGTSENDTATAAQSDYQSDLSMSPAQAQQHLSLFFALCTKVCFEFITAESVTHVLI